MKQTVRQILLCALIVGVLCSFLRLSLFDSYTIQAQVLKPVESDELTFVFDDPDILHVTCAEIRDGLLYITFEAGHPGDTWCTVLQSGNETMMIYHLVVTRLGTIYDTSTGGFTGDNLLLFALSLFCFLIFLIMLHHAIHAGFAGFYSYTTIFCMGFSLFSLITGVIMLRATIQHLQQPAFFSIRSVCSSLQGSCIRFMMLTLPPVLLVVIGLVISNLALLRYEKPFLMNLLGFIASFLILIAEGIGVFFFTRQSTGSEWELRIFNTLSNVYATVFVYFECMIAGFAICALKAALHHPAFDKDCIIVLGCYFRPDGTLTPLLTARVDAAIAFWRAQKAENGKTAILIPSGGQGEDECMAEAEAMRRYMLSQGIPDDLIFPECQSHSTIQNMRFSKDIIDKERSGGKTIFVTTNYHVFRSGIWAAQAGLPAEGLSSPTRWWFWPTAFVRECAGILQKRWLGELFLLVFLILIAAILSLIA